MYAVTVCSRTYPLCYTKIRWPFLEETSKLLQDLEYKTWYTFLGYFIRKSFMIAALQANHIYI